MAISHQFVPLWGAALTAALRVIRMSGAPPALHNPSAPGAAVHTFPNEGLLFSLSSFPCGTHEDEAEDKESCPAVQPAPHAAGAAGQAETLGGGGALTWRRGKTTQK